MIKVKIKKIHENAVVPKYAHKGDAGMDLVATSIKKKDGYVQYGTGLAMQIPEGCMGLLFPRSSISKVNLSLANAVGVVDSHYRGEVCLRFKKSLQVNNEDESKSPLEEYSVGDRVGQIIIMPVPEIDFIESEELSDTDRGTGGFGSTGK
jgi:dUTP pyrophosphatase